MSLFVGAVNTELPKIDDRLKGSFSIAASVEIPLSIREAMSDVIRAVADQLDKEQRSLKSGLGVNCIFTPAEWFTINFEPGEVSICMKIAFYPVPYLVLFASDKNKLYAILAEELCHLIWDIGDETLVKYKVTEVLQNIFPGIKVEDIYPSGCD